MFDKLGLPFGSQSTGPRRVITANLLDNELRDGWSVFVDHNVFAFVNRITKKRHLFWNDNNAYMTDVFP